MIVCKCSAVLEDGRRQCPKCGRWQMPGADVDRVLQETVCLADVEASDVARIKSGPWDVAFGGGIVRDTVTMLAGFPGAGKSTILLQLAAAVAAVEEKQVLYIAKEETAGQIKARAERLQLALSAQRRITIAPHFDCTILELLEEHEPGLIILDSLPALAGTGSAGIKPALEILDMVRAYVQKKIVPAIVIDHVIKDGDFGGAMTWQHAIDCTLMLELHQRGDGVVTTRLGSVKNRHGASGAYTDFVMTEHGLALAPPEEEGEEEGE